MVRLKRAFSRIKRRVNCNLAVRGREHVGVAIDLSAKGFFLQTSATADIGEQVDVVLQHRGGEAIRVSATVTNRRKIPQQLVSIARGGLGCRLESAPEDYYQLLADINPS